MAELLAVCVGLPKDVAWRNSTVHTGVWKQAVSGPRMVRHLNIDGDGQGDLGGHGGEQRAVLVYQIDSYRYWQAELGRDDFVHGQFGENFTVDGLADDEVCIGDRYRIGSAVFEVSQPRVTCYRVGLRMDEPRMAALMVSHRRPGFYFRVVTEGVVEAGDEIVKIESGPERMTVAEIDALLYLPGHPRDQLSPRAADPGVEPRMEGVVAGDARPRRRGRVGRQRRIDPRRGEPPAGMERVPRAPRRPAGRRDRGRHVAVARRPRRRAGPGRTTGPVRHPATAHRSRRGAADPQLLAVGPARFHRVPDQREARARGVRQQLRARPPARRRHRRGRRPARRLHPGRGRRAAAAAVGRHRGHTRAGDAPRPRRARRGAGGLVAARRPQPRRARVRRGSLRVAGRAPERACPHRLQPARPRRPRGRHVHDRRPALGRRRRSARHPARRRRLSLRSGGVHGRARRVARRPRVRSRATSTPRRSGPSPGSRPASSRR